MARNIFKGQTPYFEHFVIHLNALYLIKNCCWIYDLLFRNKPFIYLTSETNYTITNLKTYGKLIIVYEMKILGRMTYYFILM